MDTQVKATKAEIEKAIVVRLALLEGDSLSAAIQLADILFPYGLALADIQRGLPERGLRT